LVRDIPSGDGNVDNLFLLCSLIICAQLEEQARKQEAQEAELRLRAHRERETAEQVAWERIQLQNQVAKKGQSHEILAQMKTGQFSFIGDNYLLLSF
jgi:hypothetical protein